jgi:co-chaperonin GroES (HSP10)
MAMDKTDSTGVLDSSAPVVKDLRRLDETGERKEKWEIVPRHEWVLIRQNRSEEEKTEGGIVKPGEDFFLMDKGKPKSQRGAVVAVSEKITDLQAGDFVIFTNFPIDLEDIEELTGDPELKLVRDEEVYARVKRCT